MRWRKTGRVQTLGVALAVLCAAVVLALGASKTVIADSRVQTAVTSQGVPGVCAEQSRPVLVVQPLGADRTRADLQMPTPHVTSRLQPEATVRAELQVPAALSRTLLMAEGSSRSIELHVPAALLATLSAEGRVQMPQKSQALFCGPFFSLSW